MDGIWQSIRAVLRQEHGELAEGLNQVVDAIRGDDFAAAARLADELDVKAGPHIEFEERYLYPVVEQEDGEAYAMRLYDEHVDSIATLIELQEIDANTRPGNETRQRWLDGLHHAIDHLTRSYSLMDYLQSMTTTQLTQLLDRHDALHQRGHRWSQLHPPSVDSPSPIASPNADSQRKLE